MEFVPREELLKAPTGQFRVVEFAKSGDRIRRIVCDFDDFQDASDALRKVQHPNGRSIYNDRGQWIIEFWPGQYS